MKRTPLKRGEPLARGTSTLRRSRLRQIGKRGAADRRDIAAVRAAVLSRADCRCERCGAEALTMRGPLHLHHKLPRSRGGKHTVENLAVLCARCHSNVHEHAVPDASQWIVAWGGAT